MQDPPQVQFYISVTGPDGGPLEANYRDRLAEELRSHLKGAGALSVNRVPTGTRGYDTTLTALMLVVMAIQAREQIIDQAIAIQEVLQKSGAYVRDLGVMVAGMVVNQNTTAKQIKDAIWKSVPAPVAPGRRRALIFANTNYADPGLPYLSAAHDDASNLKEVLGDPAIGGFEVEVVSNGFYQDFDRRIAEFFRDVRPEDFLLLHYSGHGLRDSSGALLLATRDTEVRDLTAVYPAGNIVNRMLNSPAARTVLILDCCHAGAFDCSWTIVRDRAAGTAGPDGESGKYVLASTSADEYAYEETSAYEPSVFTGALVEGLRTGAADEHHTGKITVQSLFDHAERAVQSRQSAQRPRIVVLSAGRTVTIARNPDAGPGRPHRSDGWPPSKEERPGQLRGAVSAGSEQLSGTPDLAPVSTMDGVQTGAGTKKPESVDGPERPPRRRALKFVGIVVVTLVAIAATYAAITRPWRTTSSDPIGREVVVAVDLPFRGVTKDQAEATFNAMQIYLESQGNRAGPHSVSLKRYDNSIEPTGQWSDQQCRQNAQQHVASTDEVAVMGTFNSGCAKVEMPILNGDPAGPMVMVSHANTSMGLTKPSDLADEPERYAPSGQRSYARVIPAIDIQGAAAAALAKEQGSTKCLVLNDGSPYGWGTSTGFTVAAKAHGIETQAATWKPADSSYLPLFGDAKAAGVNCVYLGGSYGSNGAQVIKDKIQALGDNNVVRVFAPDEFRSESLWRLGQANGVYLTHSGIATAQAWSTSNPAKGVLEKYKEKHKSEPPTADAFYGVLALQVILKAIEASDGTRRNIRDQIFAAVGLSVPADRSLLGYELRIDPQTGDPDAYTVSVSQVSMGKEIFVRTSRIAKALS